MTDTTMREAFEDFCKKRYCQNNNFLRHEAGSISGQYINESMEAYWQLYQDATERATQVERERCAAVCEREMTRTLLSADFAGVKNVDTRDYQICAAAIRQGGKASEAPAE
jgi:hypothetical protein